MAFYFTVTNTLANVTVNSTANSVVVTNTSRPITLYTNATIIRSGGSGGNTFTGTIATLTATNIYVHDALVVQKQTVPYALGEIDCGILYVGPPPYGDTAIETGGGNVYIQNISGSDGNLQVGGYVTSSKGYKVGNTQVIDSNGNWVGPAISVEDIDNNVATLSNTAFTQSGSIFNSITGTDQIQLNSFDSTQFDSAKYFIKIKDGSDYHIAEIVLFYNGTDIDISEYGIITNNGLLGAFTADVIGSTVRLLFTPTDADNLSIRIEKTLMAV